MTHVPAPGPTLSRRALVGGAAVGVGALTVGLTDGAAEAATRQGSLPASVDVVVVGGGISGLTTARQIAKSGRSVLVVEARDRVGGRVLNHTLKSGATIESRGAFIGPTQDHIAALAAELGVPTFLEYNTGKSVYNSSGVLGRQEYDGTVPPDPTILPDAAILQYQLDQWASEIDVAAPWNHPRAKEWDGQTLGQYIRNTAINKDGIGTLIKCWTQPGFGADPDQLSLLYVIWYTACSGDENNKGTFERNSDTGDGAQQKRFVGGSQLVPLRMASQLGSRVALNAAVAEIDQTSTGAVVKTARGTVKAKRVVVAVPPELARQITFSPALNARRQALFNHMNMGDLMKCDAVYDKPFWRDAGLNGFGIADHGAVRAAFDNSPANGTPGVLLAFVGGATWRQYGLQTLAARRAAVLQGFAEMFGPQALKPIEYVEHDWTKEQWTRGAPVAIMGPGTLTSYGPEIRVPHGRIHWAGTETSTYWTGYMDGAVRAGERSSAEVLKLL
ncbi:MAG: FAD-dependent oxidoreductase [Marmoricola sp.]|nr:FAD-dependent oxidoreductase [Marmoricola sp.]